MSEPAITSTENFKMTTNGRRVKNAVNRAVALGISEVLKAPDNAALAGERP